MHLPNAFIQRYLHYIQRRHLYQFIYSLGIKPMPLGLLAPCYLNASLTSFYNIFYTFPLNPLFTFATSWLLVWFCRIFKSSPLHSCSFKLEWFVKEFLGHKSDTEKLCCISSTFNEMETLCNLWFPAVCLDYTAILGLLNGESRPSYQSVNECLLIFL